MSMTLENELPWSPTSSPPSDTLLTISGFGSMLYQARGLTQTLEVIKQANQQNRKIGRAHV